MPYSAPGPFLGAQAATGYQISRSLRFRSSASAYLNRTPGSAGNRKLWTWSAWVKRGSLGSNQALFSAGDATVGNTNWLAFISTDALAISVADGTAYVVSSSLYRDPSAWYHVVVVYDSDNATASNRIKFYVNGVQLTAFSTATYPSSGLQGYINNTAAHGIGARQRNGFDYYFDGYLAELNFIDGQALTPSSFGETDATTGVWKPKAYTGTYGTNGFYLKFADNSAATAAAIGKDSSGNGNNWTPNNISVTAGTTYDSMIDTPTPYDDNGTGRGNYPVWNTLLPAVSGHSYSNGNLTFSSNNTGSYTVYTNGYFPTTGKYYLEFKFSAINTTFYAGVGVGNKTYTSDGVTGGASWTTANTIGIAVDIGAGTFQGYKDGVAQTLQTGASVAGQQPYAFIIGSSSTFSLDVNFGQRPFANTPPSGFKALNTQNLPTPTIANGAQYMIPVTYTGTGSAQSITATSSNSGNNPLGTTFQPDFVWIKIRSAVSSHCLYDVLRGVRTGLFSNLTNAEVTEAAGVSLTAFNSNGFSLGTDNAVTGSTNLNGGTYVGWQWKANGSGSSGAGTGGITSVTYSANVTAKFSVVKYTGSSTSGTVTHGLGVAPSMIIVKALGTPNGSARSWFVYHTSIGATKTLYLNLTDAAATTSGPWNNTAPDSSVFTLGTEPSVNWASNNYVAYCFAPVAGYSAFGSYTGNGSADGPFVYTGFRPRYVMVKRTDATSNWFIHDTARDTYNVSASNLYAELSNAEDTNAAGNIDFLSNGFKSRTGSGSNPNVSGGTYIYMAFAENPLKYSLAR